MNSRIRIGVVVVVVVVLAAAATAWWLHARQQGARPGAVLYGNVDIRELELAFRQGGRLASVKVDEGSRVRQGEVLAELDDRPYRDALVAAQAEVLRAKAEADKLRSGSRAQEIRRAEAAVAQAEAQLVRLESDFARQTGLASSGAASVKTLEAVRAARDEASAGLASAQQALSLLREGSRREDIAAAEARLAAAEAARSQAETALSDTRLVAPSDAVVLARVREPGSMVGNRDAVLTLSLLGPTYVRAYVAEPQLARVAPGTPVWVRTDGSDKLYRGQVGFVSPRAEFTPKSVETTALRTDLVYRVRVVVPASEGALLQGMPVTVLLDDPNRS